MTPRSRPDRPPRRRHLAAAAALAALAALSCAPAGMAREADRQAPASIEADRVEIDRPAGVSRYFGNVVFVQSTLRITGERMTLRAPNGVLEHAEVHGERATIRQQTEDGDMVHARARHIVYNAAEGIAILTREAELQRGSDRFAAGRIEYHPDTGRIDAAGGDDGGRVRIRIEPQQDGDGSGDGGAGADSAP